MKAPDTIPLEHPFLAGLDDSFLEALSTCRRDVRFEPEQCLVREGEPANQFYLIQSGKVALEISAAGRGTTTLQTIGQGETVGISWLIPPYRWIYDAKALEPVAAVSLDTACLRQKCEADHDLGYEMMKRMVPILARRLQTTRLQVLDAYGAFAL